METIVELHNKQTLAEAEASRIREAIEARLSLPEAKALAVELHSIACKMNHGDECGWEHETKLYGPEDEWQHNAHSIWLEKANYMLSKVDAQTAIHLAMTIAMPFFPRFSTEA